MKSHPCLLLLLLAGAVQTPAAVDALPEPDLTKEIIARLRDPAQRMAAIVEIEQRTDNQKEWTDADRRAVPFGVLDPRLTLCPARDPAGPPLYLLTWKSDFSAHRQALEDFKKAEKAEDAEKDPGPAAPAAEKDAEPKSPPLSVTGETNGLWTPPATAIEGRKLTFLTEKGRVAWPHKGDNFMDPGWIGDFDKDGVLDRAESTGISFKGAENTSIKVASIRSLEKSPRTTLTVVYNWMPDTDMWTFAMLDVDRDGSLEACFGPASEKGGVLASCEVVYRWDAEKKAWRGPEGSKDDHFLLYLGTEKDLWTWLRQLHEDGGLTNESPAPRTPVKLPPREPAAPKEK